MSNIYISPNVDDRIHFVIIYKKIIREFLKHFRQRYFKIKEFRENFNIEKDFKILTKEGQGLELGLKGQFQPINYSNYHALQLHNNALQAKL